MAGKTVAFETNHEEMIHDAKMDYYGKLLATASSDRSIKIFEISGDQHRHVANLHGHDGPVWQVAWSHPKFGQLLASCSYARQVFIWKESAKNSNHWIRIFEDREFDASVNSVSWAPQEFGLMLAAACADGYVTVFTFKDNKWEKSPPINAHKSGVNAISWAPGVQSGALLKSSPAPQGGDQHQQEPVRRFVTGGCDNRIKIWRQDPQTSEWVEEKSFADANIGVHKDWVRDVSWAPNLGLPTSTIASCSEDKTVAIWTEENNTWRQSALLEFDTKVWSVSWSTMGNILAVAEGDNKVSLHKESSDGTWKNLTKIDEHSVQESKSDS